jgi:hypothetical protein
MEIQFNTPLTVVRKCSLCTLKPARTGSCAMQYPAVVTFFQGYSQEKLASRSAVHSLNDMQIFLFVRKGEGRKNNKDMFIAFYRPSFKAKTSFSIHARVETRSVPALHMLLFNTCSEIRYSCIQCLVQTYYRAGSQKVVNLHSSETLCIQNVPRCEHVALLFISSIELLPSVVETYSKRTILVR